MIPNGLKDVRPMSRRTTLQTWRDFTSGQSVIMLVETKGATVDDGDIVYPPGTPALIAAIMDFGEYQGMGVDVVIGAGERTICNSFDDRDVERSGSVPFRLV